MLDRVCDVDSATEDDLSNSPTVETTAMSLTIDSTSQTRDDDPALLGGSPAQCPGQLAAI